MLVQIQPRGVLLLIVWKSLVVRVWSMESGYRPRCISHVPFVVMYHGHDVTSNIVILAYWCPKNFDFSERLSLMLSSRNQNHRFCHRILLQP